MGRGSCAAEEGALEGVKESIQWDRTCPAAQPPASAGEVFIPEALQVPSGDSCLSGAVGREQRDLSFCLPGLQRGSGFPAAP